MKLSAVTLTAEYEVERRHTPYTQWILGLSSDRIGKLQRRLALPSRKDDMHMPHSMRALRMLLRQPAAAAAIRCILRVGSLERCFLQIGAVERWNLCRLWRGSRPRASPDPQVSMAQARQLQSEGKGDEIVWVSMRVQRPQLSDA